MLLRIITKFPLAFSFFFLFAVVPGQDVVRELKLAGPINLEVVNRYGRIDIASVKASPDGAAAGRIVASSQRAISEDEVKISTSGPRTIVQVAAANSRDRIDLKIEIVDRSNVRAQTTEGAISVAGNFSSVKATTDTGTVTLDVPTDDLRYQFHWTEARPRYVADFDLEKVKELSAGRFQIKGRYSDQERSKAQATAEQETEDKPAAEEARPVALDVSTARGIILLNVPPNEVGSDLRERPLTEAAKAIVRSGDSLLMESVRRAAPKYYGDYVRSLPPYRREPVLTVGKAPEYAGDTLVQTALVRVTDLRNRAIGDLKPGDFEVTESGTRSEIISVEPSRAPFNLVLLLDVSGSVENYVDFIRKAARSFVNTVDRSDRTSIVVFNEDIKVLSKFTTDKELLSESLDTFGAGGGTAYYDALAYVVADTLRPLKGERTAIVILTDGDDNRSFLAFDSLLGSIQESGALIYPLYVPSGLIAQAEQAKNVDIDPMRKKYMSLTAKSSGEGEKLAKVSGGVYYPITQIAQIQRAYDDIAAQLRTAYLVKFRTASRQVTGPSKLKIKVKQDNAFVTINSVTSER